MLARRQHGVVERAQLIAIGLTPREIDHRVAVGRLHRIHRGVYAVGHRRITREGEWMAAVLAGGSDAVLSHASAASLWELHTGNARPIDVSVAGDRRGTRGVRIHRHPLAAAETTARRGIPVTTPLRTIVDLASIAGDRPLEQAIRQALYHRLTSPAALTGCLSAYGGRRGMKRMRKALAQIAEVPGITRSELEQRFLRLLRKHRLPMPRLNVPIRLGGNWIEADCVWPDERVIVELDGRAAHDTPLAFEADRARDLALQAAGWTVVRITWNALNDERVVAARIRALLQRSASPAAASRRT